MADQIQYAVRWKIHDGKLEEFKALAADATALVKANEPDMLGYHWYFDASETTCTLIEQYPSAAHILVHLGNVGEALGKLVEVSDISIDVFGAIDDEARAALDPLGAVYHDHLTGFSRY
ncbi:MAG: quinol monooxygenase YgiN [Candidatus Aldehydirespiratoraceae bacterium]|jgi:quinol monooxygenase YgiN